MRSDLIETFKIVNRKCDIRLTLNYFFQLDEGDRMGHDQKMLNKRFRLSGRKYAFSNRVIDKNSSGDEIANVNFYAVRPGNYRNSLK